MSENVTGTERRKHNASRSPLLLVYLRWRVIDGDLDGLAGRADVDHHQDVTVTHLKGGTKKGERQLRNMPVSEQVIHSPHCY